MVCTGKPSHSSIQKRRTHGDVFKSRRPRHFCCLALIVAALVLAASPARAQQGGVIQGTVADAQGGVLPGVTLTLRNTDTGVVRTGVSEADGQYRFAGLQPGAYELKAELQGFATVAVDRLTLTIGSAAAAGPQDAACRTCRRPSPCTGVAPVIEVTRTEVAQVITQEQIDTLPMADRQPASLVLLLPGTNMDNTQVRRAQANIGAGGINNQMNAYFLDGSSNWSTNSGQQHAEMPQLAIREFRVNVAQASAEHGGNVAGLVSIVTRSGTNRFSGEALEYFKNQSLQARDKNAEDVGAPKPDYKRNQWGLGFGGPIVRDKVHFYAAIEYQTENKSFTVNSGQPQFYSKLEGVVPDRLPAAQVFRARRLAGQPVAERVRALRPRLRAHRLRRVRRHQRGVQPELRRVAARHERDRPHVGRQQPRLNDFRVQYPARLFTARPDLRERRCGSARANFRPSGSTATRRSTTSRACTGDRAPAA